MRRRRPGIVDQLDDLELGAHVQTGARPVRVSNLGISRLVRTHTVTASGVVADTAAYVPAVPARTSTPAAIGDTSPMATGAGADADDQDPLATVPATRATATADKP